MLPRTVVCENCGQKAYVRAYGRVVYDAAGPSQIVSEPEIESINLTIDCPECGVLVQVYYPATSAELVDASR
jgi:hypothetical protein